jgi:hypothetical protein
MRDGVSVAGVVELTRPIRSTGRTTVTDRVGHVGCHLPRDGVALERAYESRPCDDGT